MYHLGAWTLRDLSSLLSALACQGIGKMDGSVPGVPDRRIKAMHTLYRDAQAGSKVAVV